MSELEFRKLNRKSEKCRIQGSKQLYVCKDIHERIKKISEDSGIPMYEVAEMLLEYGIEHVKWV